MKLLKNEQGATAIEYGIIVALISVVVIATVKTIGTKLKASYEQINTELTTAETTP